MPSLVASEAELQKQKNMVKALNQAVESGQVTGIAMVITLATGHMESNYTGSLSVLACCIANLHLELLGKLFGNRMPAQRFDA